MKTYQSVIGKIKRTLSVDSDIARMKLETIQDGKWCTQNDIVYTQGIVNGWGFATLEKFVEWKVKERGMEEIGLECY